MNKIDNNVDKIVLLNLYSLEMVISMKIDMVFYLEIWAQCLKLLNFYSFAATFR